MTTYQCPCGAFHRAQPHLLTAHSHWTAHVESGDTVIDATCGNGHDALFLAQLALKENAGTLFAIDLQSAAILNTEHLLKTELAQEIWARVHLIRGCHSKFPPEILPGTVSLITYNLGYLPGGDKNKTTMLETTLQSLKSSMELVKPGGVICITCYPGHSEGKREEKSLLDYAANLDAREWLCSHQSWINRLNAPSLLLITRVQ